MDRASTFRAVRWILGAAVLAMGVVIVLAYAGPDAPPDIETPPTPVGQYTPVVLFAVPAALWWVVVRWLRFRYWRQTGSETTLTPTSGRLFTPVTFTGTVDDRQVTARTIQLRRDQTSGNDATFYTVVSATLHETPEDGVAISRSDEGAFGIDTNAQAFEDGVAAVANSAGLAKAMLTDDVKQAMQSAPDQSPVYAGNVKLAAITYESTNRLPVLSWLYQFLKRDVLGSRGTGETTDEWGGGPDSVVQLVDGTVMDGEQLQRQVDLVVAVAEAFERQP